MEFVTSGRVTMSVGVVAPMQGGSKSSWLVVDVRSPLSRLSSDSYASRFQPFSGHGDDVGRQGP